MKKVLLGVFILLVGLGQSQAEEITTIDVCIQVLKTSEAVMMARQEGVDINKLWDSEQSDFASRQLVDAYSQNTYLSDEYKTRIAKEFAVKYFMQCMDEYS